MMNRLPSHGIPCSDEMLKPQLYRLIQIHKPRALVDHILISYTHLRLPPYHPDLNRREMMWSEVKQWVASRNVSFKIEDVKLCVACRYSVKFLFFFLGSTARFKPRPP
jgi:transposase